MLFNKIIVVCSQETESYLYDFNHHNLRAIETEKKGIIIPVSGENRRTRSFSRQNTRRISLKYARSLAYPTLCIRPRDITIINPNYPLKAELADNVYDTTISDITLYSESAVLLVNVDDSSSDNYDFELRFPLYIFKRYQLHEQKRSQIALWQPNIIILKD